MNYYKFIHLYKFDILLPERRKYLWETKKSPVKKAASAAAKVLRNPKSSKAAKTAAASALTQRPNRKKR